MSRRIFVRMARGSDREAVFRFCEKTWSWGDYIPRVWDDWLKDKRGRVFIALLDDVPVGIVHLSLDKPREVWLSGARTDPDFRRTGVATALIEKCLEYARKRGARVARLVTASDNVAARAAMRKLGFKSVAEFVEMVAENVKAETSTRSGWAEESEIGAIWRYLQASEIYRRTGGLYTVLYHFYSLGKLDLSRFVKMQKVILHIDRKRNVDGLVLFDDTTASEWRRNTVQTCYVDGDYGAVLDMMKFLKGHCYASGIRKIYGFAYNHQPIIAALKKLGFKPPDSIDIVYAKRILEKRNVEEH